MDTKGLQHCKHRKKMKSSTNNGKPEVFVLPPDLLKKLGISIGNINNPQDIPYDAASKSESSNNNEHTTNIQTSNCSQNSSDTSILETANLMKKSVLLSPTFVSTITNVIPGEVEISSTINNKEDVSMVPETSVSNLIRAENSLHEPIDSAEHTNLDPPNNYHQDEFNPDLTLNGHNINQHCSLTTVDENKLQMSDENENLNKVHILFDTKLSNSYNNSNTTTEPTSDFETKNTIAQRLSSKINIISEETIPLSKLKELKKTSDKNSLIPVEVNSIIATKSSCIIRKSGSSDEHLNNCDLLKSETKNEKNYVDTNHTFSTATPVENMQITFPSRVVHLKEDQDTCITDPNVSNIFDNKNNELSSKDTTHLNLLDNVNTGSLERNDLSNGNNEYLCENNAKANTNCFNEAKNNLSKEPNLIDNVKPANKDFFTRNESSYRDNEYIGENERKRNTNSSNEFSNNTSKDLNLLDTVKTASKETLEKNESCRRDIESLRENNTAKKDTCSLNETKNNISEEKPLIDVAVNIFNMCNQNAAQDKCVDSDLNCSSQETNDAKPLVNQAPNNRPKDFGFESDLNKCNNSLDTVKSNVNAKLNDNRAIEAETKVGNKNNKSMKSIHNNISCKKKKEDESVSSDNLSNILNVTKEISNNITHGEANKVKEIAAYLKKFSNIYTNKQKVKKHLKNENNKSATMNSNTNITTSKLWIQGVEKPGGIDVDKECAGECKVLKTYTRRNYQKQSTSSTITLQKSETSDLVVTPSVDHELNTVNKLIPSKQQEFCLCYDFGRLAYYDYDSLYEHIHFWQNNSTNCETDLIFAIYSDEPIVNINRSEVDVKQKTEETFETHNVCWNVFNSEICQEAVTFDQEQDKLKNECSNNIVLELSNVAENDDNIIDYETLDRDHRETNNYNSDVILETVDHHMVDAAESDNSTMTQKLQTDVMIHDDSTVINDTVETVDSEKNSETLRSATAPVPESQLSNVIEKISVKVEGSTEENASFTKEANKKQKKELENKVTLTPRQEKVVKSTEIRKRSLSVTKLSETTANNSYNESSAKKNIKCGICDGLFSESDWRNHVKNQHQYIAWKAGSSIDLDDPDLLRKLSRRLKSLGVLTCSICNLEFKSFKKFIVHVKDCIKQKKKSARKARPVKKENMTCGVCQKEVQSAEWIEHIGREHNYLAWSEGKEVLDLEDEDMVWQHLQNIIRVKGSLTCYKCGLDRRRVKLYLAHVKRCDGSGYLDDSVMSADLNSTSNLEGQQDKIVKCGVCQQDVHNGKWIEHIAKEHNYLAWQDGSIPLNVDDEEAVWNHLQHFVRRSGGLICYKCGLNRKRVKLYLTHIETCDGTGVSMDDYFMSDDLNSTHNTTSIIEDADTSHISMTEEKIVICGVCNEKLPEKDWTEHIGKEHNYLAWQEGKTPLDLDNEEMVWEHLQNIIRFDNGLTCYKCGLHRKRVKLYLSHIKTCDGTSIQSDRVATNSSGELWLEVPEIDTKVVKCAVCSQDVRMSDWMQHICKEHSYLAWIEGTTPLNVEDELQVKQYLNNIAKENNGLSCSKCDKNIKYPKTYLQHVKECTGVSEENNQEESSNIELITTVAVKSEEVTCGVCENKVPGNNWINHIEREHQYLAWIEGQIPLDLTDTAAVQKHLYDLTKMLGGLKCIKCGVRRKYVKAYLHHVETCEETPSLAELPTVLMSQDELECALCGEKVMPREWRQHAMKNHYNIAWVVGDVPIELNNPYAVESYLKEYMARYKKLVCKVCSASRVSYYGFYAHILTCGKTEEETEQFKAVCEICNNKYLRIYKSQHMTMHKEKELLLERKKLAAKEQEKVIKKEEPEIIQSGRRKAAEKAKSVIEKYKNSILENAHQCCKCGFSTELEKEFLDHACVENKWEGASDSDESVQLDHCSEEESDDETDIDSNISDEERAAQREHEYPSNNKKKHYPLNVVNRLPYRIDNMNNYMKVSSEHFNQTYLAKEGLFPQWTHCELEELSENDVLQFTPPLEESCKVRLGETEDWITCSRFESKKYKDISVLFLGASAQCLSWAPSHPDSDVASCQRQYLAVVAHLAEDVPRLAWDQTHTGPGLIQIWDFGNFNSSMPQFALGIAHDYGTMWAIDWCPSGVRDVLDSELESNEMFRLGLLSAACSNGSAYIFSVPYPSSIGEKGQVIYRIKPVAELRFSMNTDRKLYQATAIKWSTQKGHSFVVVGYSDGSTAYFDLNGESPLLRTIEDNITVFYPYHDERVQNSCIEDVDVFPRGSGRARGVVCVGGAGGAGAGALQSHVAAARVLFPPHWPAALLAGDDCLVNQSVNELEWWGGGRRLGGMRGAAGCAWCGRVVTASLPLLRIMRTHPGFTDLHRQIIGAIQMISLGNKRKRRNDELAMIVEPITYSEVIKKYGIDFRQAFGKDRVTQQKFSSLSRDAYPERFPLSDVEAMQFCPTNKHHQKLAIAVHAGIIFVITV